MDVHFTCPFCEQPMTVDQQGAGADVSCPACGRSVTIPQQSDRPPDAPKPPAVPPVPRPPSVPITVSPRPQPMQVIVKDFEMSFGSMVIFMIKWSLAAIPALLILALILAAIGFAFFIFLDAFGRVGELGR